MSCEQRTPYLAGCGVAPPSAIRPTFAFRRTVRPTQKILVAFSRPWARCWPTQCSSGCWKTWQHQKMSFFPLQLPRPRSARRHGRGRGGRGGRKPSSLGHSWRPSCEEVSDCPSRYFVFDLESAVRSRNFPAWVECVPTWQYFKTRSKNVLPIIDEECTFYSTICYDFKGKPRSLTLSPRDKKRLDPIEVYPVSEPKPSVKPHR